MGQHLMEQGGENARLLVGEPQRGEDVGGGVERQVRSVVLPLRRGPATSRPEFAISHAPGHMLITDARDSDYVVP